MLKIAEASLSAKGATEAGKPYFAPKDSEVLGSKAAEELAGNFLKQVFTQKQSLIQDRNSIGQILTKVQIDEAFYYGLLTAAPKLPNPEAKCRFLDTLALVEKHSVVFCLELAKVMAQEGEHIDVLESIARLVLAQFHAT